MLLKFQGKSYLIINSYFPTDPRTVGGRNEELEVVLAEIRNLINSTKFNYLYLLGDINCSFVRNSSHVEAVKNFMMETNLYSVWTDFNIDFTHSFQKEDGECYVNIIDHFLTLNCSKENIVDAGVLHLVQNQSDHEPIYLVIKCENEEPKEKENHVKQEPIVGPKPKWKLANEDQKLEFNDVVFRKLSAMEIPRDILECSDVHCEVPEHIAKLDLFVEELLQSLCDSGFETLPLSTPKKRVPNSKRKVTAGWKQYVEPYQDNAKFWHAIWNSAGRPQNTELHNIMKRTRNRFHYQVRKCKRVEEFIRNQKIVENCLDGDQDLFKEIKKQRSNHNEDEVTIDGASGDEIPGKFAEVYKNLYNMSSDDEEVSIVRNQIKDKIGQHDIIEVDKINSKVIKEAIGKIKANKTDAVFDFSSDFLKHSPDILYELLAIVIKSFVTHGHVTSSLLIATLVPVVKDKLADLCSSKNYRSIAISSLILKLLDWIILLNYGHLLKTNDFQFGFQKGSNTSLCSWVVYETIDQYLNGGSTVYGCLLDCSKAFDTVEHSKLFVKLLDAGFPPIIVRLLIAIYRNQTANVRWKGKLSEEFPIRNGVRQGAVISPIFFNFYMNNLFNLLKNNGSGCVLSDYYAGCYGYADDLLFLCPSRGGLQEMLDIADKYVSDHNISFSTDPEPKKSKTKGIIFTRTALRFSPAPLLLNGNLLPWIEEAKYLGNVLTSIPDGWSKDAKVKRAQYIERNCEINQEFPTAHPRVKCNINRIYNSSYPGSVLYDLSSDSVSHLVNSWSVSTRHMWDVPRETHRYMVEELGGQHAHSMLIVRFVKFLQWMKKSPKLVVQYLLGKVANDMRTVTGRNIRYILEKIEHRKDLFKVKISWLKKRINFCEIPDNEKWRVNFVEEIVNIRQNVFKLDLDDDSFLTSDQLSEILDYLCTS